MAKPSATNRATQSEKPSGRAVVGDVATHSLAKTMRQPRGQTISDSAVRVMPLDSNLDPIANAGGGPRHLAGKRFFRAPA